jgi:hypothetical protein
MDDYHYGQSSTLKKNNIITTFNSNDIGTRLYGVLCKKFHMLLLHDHFARIVILGPFQR